MDRLKEMVLDVLRGVSREDWVATVVLLTYNQGGITRPTYLLLLSQAEEFETIVNNIKKLAEDCKAAVSRVPEQVNEARERWEEVIASTRQNVRQAYGKEVQKAFDALINSRSWI
ncbi:MAG: hypothetical protein A2172_02480 [Candidatus Woykebacteria bacterium RBG_13_40_15]|uniref:Uncharacterized protein n=1 Tax=Candidatus Woykebacteria bacterium RBG_13_40_15 TaxID=1802593 RepID=A0A1G1W687_9BACT|nr:MAG: hypothetical protein A2172_02480 [Candidatus Woykebacteria bacterium RBG_13_40_15]